MRRNKRILEKRHWNFLLTAIVVLTALCYLPTLNNGSVNYDDDTVVFQNKTITQLSGATLKEMFTAPSGGNYHPITTLSLALNYQLSGDAPFSYHLINLILHLLTTVLVFFFSKHLSGNSFRITLLTTLFFGIHPMHVESVAWIVERKDVLFAFFYLSSLLVYLKHRNHPKPHTYALLLLTGVMAMLSKPAAVTLPLVFLLIDYYFNGKIELKQTLRHIPLFLVALGVGLATVSAQANDAIGDMTQYSMFQRVGFAAYGLVFYAFKAMVPIQFSVMHPYPNGEGLWTFKLWAASFVLAGLLFLLWKYRKNGVVLFAAAFYLLNLVLVLQFFSVGRAIVAERYTYLPYIGLFFLLGYMWEQLAQNYSTRHGATVMQWAFVLLAIYCVPATFLQNKVWKSSETLWSKTIKEYPNDWYAYLGRGNHFRDQSQYQLALKDFSKAIALNPSHYELYFNRGDLYKQVNHLDAAISDYSRAIELKDDYAQAYVNRGQFYYEKGKHKEALADLNKALALDGNIPEAYINRGGVYMATNLLEEAIADYNTAIDLDANNYLAWYNRGNAWSVKQEYTKAIADFARAISINPEKHEPYNNTGSAYYQMGKLEEALQAYTELVNKFEGFADGWLNRSIVYAQLGNKTAALNDALRAQKLGKQVSASYLQGLQQ